MGDQRTGDDPELYARRASSFGAAAAEYEAHRPGYPAEAVAWALEPAGAGRPLDVLDMAAGTGKLSRTLIALGHRVTAVEPDAAMLDELRRRVPEATTAIGSAERIPLPDASVDAVVIGQAIHWFDQDKALPEFARVLRPGGPLAALSNTEDDRVEWIAGFEEVSPGQVSYLSTATLPGRRIEPNPAFSPVQEADFPHVLRRTAESLIATVATHSHMLVLEPAERAAAEERMRGYLRSCPETSAGEFDLHLVTRVQRCVRADG